MTSSEKAPIGLERPVALRRVMIIGPAASGKTTLARRMAELLNVPAIHLDRHYWLPSYRRPDPANWVRKVSTLTLNGAWVMDGNYFEYPESVDVRVASADLLIFLRLARRVFMARLLLRYCASDKRQIRDDLGMPDRLNLKHLWKTYHFYTVHRFALAQLIRNAKAQRKMVVVLRSPQQVDAFLQTIARLKGGSD